MTEALNAREIQSQKIRAALISACEDLLGKFPIDAITINNIVETAGVAKGSFYNHFQDKEGLAAVVSSAIREEIEQTVSNSNKNVTDPAYRIARGYCQHIKLAVNNPQRAMIMMRSAEIATTSDENPLNNDIHLDVEDGIKSGRFSTRCDEAGLILIMGATIFTMVRVIEQGLSADQAIELSTKVLPLMLCGFGVNEEEAFRIVSDSAKDIILG